MKNKILTFQSDDLVYFFFCTFRTFQVAKHNQKEKITKSSYAMMQSIEQTVKMPLLYSVQKMTTGVSRINFYAIKGY